MHRRLVERSWRAWVREGNVNKPHPLYRALPPRPKEPRKRGAGMLGFALHLASLGGRVG